MKNIIAALAVLMLCACTPQPVLMPVTSSAPPPTATMTAVPATASKPRPTPTATLPLPTIEPFPTAFTVADPRCIRSFSAFAYDRPEDVHSLPNRETEIAGLLPDWEKVAVIPRPDSASRVEWNSADFAHQTNEGLEIWFYQYYSSQGYPFERIHRFLVYSPEKKAWKSIASEISGSDLLIYQPFVLKDGSVWGRVSWHATPLSVERQFPALARYDEGQGNFEPVAAAPMVHLPPSDTGIFDLDQWPTVLLDDQDIFWIFIPKDGLYRFDPFTLAAEKQVDLPKISITYAIVSPLGKIYFEDNDDPLEEGEILYSLRPGSIYEFDTRSRVLTQIDVPDDPWPDYSGLLVDRRGNLWFGSVGYRDSAGGWHLVDPKPAEVFQHLGDSYYGRPWIVAESRDGRLWFEASQDPLYPTDGTAWYDPQTGEGCMIANFAMDLVVDDEGNIWTTLGDRVYRYPASAQ